MSTSSRVGRRDEEWLRSAWDWAGDISASTSYATRIVLLPGTRKGIWVARCEAAHVVEGRLVAVHTQVKQDFPTARHATLAEALHGLVLQLDKALTPTPLEAAAER